MLQFHLSLSYIFMWCFWTYPRFPSGWGRGVIKTNNVLYFSKELYWYTCTFHLSWFHLIESYHITYAWFEMWEMHIINTLPNDYIVPFLYQNHMIIVTKGVFFFQISTSKSQLVSILCHKCFQFLVHFIIL